MYKSDLKYNFLIPIIQSQLNISYNCVYNAVTSTYIILKNDGL